MHAILVENITNSGPPKDDIANGSKTPGSPGAKPAHAVSHRPGLHLTDEKVDSGIGSECSYKREQRHKHVTSSRDVSSTSIVQPMECLFTARSLFVSVYDLNVEESAEELLVPVVRVSFIQPAFNCTRLTESSTVQMSCFDFSLAKSEPSSKSAG